MEVMLTSSRMWIKMQSFELVAWKLRKSLKTPARADVETLWGCDWGELKREWEGREQTLTQWIIDPDIDSSNSVLNKYYVTQQSPGEKMRNLFPASKWLITVFIKEETNRHAPSPFPSLPRLSSKQASLPCVMTLRWSHRASQIFHVKTYIKNYNIGNYQSVLLNLFTFFTGT